jgi:hypothetical protein
VLCRGFLVVLGNIQPGRREGFLAANAAGSRKDAKEQSHRTTKGYKDSKRSLRSTELLSIRFYLLSKGGDIENKKASRKTKGFFK